MESITIIPKNKKQFKALKELARALNADFQVNDQKIKNQHEFLKEFEDAKSIDESKTHTLKYVKSLWEK